MFATRANTKLCSPKQAAQLTRAVAPLLSTYSSSSSCCYSSPSATLGLRLTTSTTTTPRRNFSTTPANHLRDFFPAKETAHIRTTPPAWPHHGYSEAEMLAVEPGHRPPQTLGDRVAWMLIRTARWCMDTVTGMSKEQKTDRKRPTTAVVAEQPLSESQWVSVSFFAFMSFPLFQHVGWVGSLTDTTKKIACPVHLPRVYRWSPRHGGGHAPPPAFAEVAEAG